MPWKTTLPFMFLNGPLRGAHVSCRHICRRATKTCRSTPKEAASCATSSHSRTIDSSHTVWLRNVPHSLYMAAFGVWIAESFYGAYWARNQSIEKTFGVSIFLRFLPHMLLDESRSEIKIWESELIGLRNHCLALSQKRPPAKPVTSVLNSPRAAAHMSSSP